MTKLQSRNAYIVDEWFNDQPIYNTILTAYDQAPRKFLRRMRELYRAARPPAGTGWPAYDRSFMELLQEVMRRCNEIKYGFEHGTNPGNTMNDYRFTQLLKNPIAYAKVKHAFTAGADEFFKVMYQEISSIYIDIPTCDTFAKDKANGLWLPMYLRTMIHLSQLWEKSKHDDQLDALSFAPICSPVTLEYGIIYDDNPREVYTMKKFHLLPAIIENRLYINDAPATEMSDEAIFAQISALEDEAQEMDFVETPCAKLKARAKALRKSAKKLAKIVDAR